MNKHNLVLKVCYFFSMWRRDTEKRPCEWGWNNRNQHYTNRFHLHSIYGWDTGLQWNKFTRFLISNTTFLLNSVSHFSAFETGLLVNCALMGVIIETSFLLNCFITTNFSLQLLIKCRLLKTIETSLLLNCFFLKHIWLKLLIKNVIRLIPDPVYLVWYTSVKRPGTRLLVTTLRLCIFLQIECLLCTMMLDTLFLTWFLF